MNDILKMKIVRDSNRIYTSSNSFLKKIKSGYSLTYLNLLELIRNSWLQLPVLQIKKFGISDLNNIDVDFLYDISLCHNVKVTNSPIFQHIYLENSEPDIAELKTRTLSVQDLRNIDTKEFIKKHPFDLFYIYAIDRTNARWNQLKDDKSLLRYERKLKLEQLKKVEIELINLMS